jgi:branched-chain amino acid transport system ATP-binding protein
VASLLVEQNMRAALKVADRAYVLRVGRIVKHGPAKDMAGDQDMRKAYLGA